MDAISYHSTIAKKFDDHYTQSRIFDERFQIWTHFIDKYLLTSDNVLDAGCGTGIFSFYIAKKGNRVTGIDGSQDMIELCKSKSLSAPDLKVDFLNLTLPFGKNVLIKRFDFIMASSVLEYVDDFRSCLMDLETRLKANGIFVVSLPNRKGVYRKLEKFCFVLFKKPQYLKYVKNYSDPEELNLVMSKMGFETLEFAFYSSGSILEKTLKLLLVPKKYSNSLFLGVYKKK